MVTESVFRVYEHSQAYYRYLVKKKETGDGEEKLLPIEMLGRVMVAHGEEFGSDSAYGKSKPLGFLSELNLLRTFFNRTWKCSHQCGEPSRPVCRLVSFRIPDSLGGVPGRGCTISCSTEETQVSPVACRHLERTLLIKSIQAYL
jgi:hypothetical protein